MRVFVLCTGRCGSTAFARACRHAANYTAAHESGLATGYTLRYPDRHIEVDNRLSWFVGPLHERYPDAFYVHLLRNEEAVARSFAARGAGDAAKLFHGFMSAIKQGRHVEMEREARHLVHTVNANVRHFLRDKPHLTIDIETAARTFPAFWKRIGARGDLDAALAEFSARRNKGPAA